MLFAVLSGACGRPSSGDTALTPPVPFVVAPAPTATAAPSIAAVAVETLAAPSDPAVVTPISAPNTVVTSTPMATPTATVTPTAIPTATPAPPTAIPIGTPTATPTATPAPPTPTPSPIPEAPSSVAEVQDLAGSLASLTDILLWHGFRADNLRVVKRAIEGQDARVVAADIQPEAGEWSGIKFTAPKPFDWSGLQGISMKVRWSTADGTGSFAFVVEDAEERSWRWYPTPLVFPPDDQGWSTWDLVLREADQKSDGFRWDQIRWVSISAYADADSTASDSVLEFGSVEAISAPPEAGNSGWDVERVFPGIAAPQIVGMVHPGDGTDRFFLLLKEGELVVFEDDPGATSLTTFLDLTENVFSDSTESGLLGLVFDPEYRASGHFYVYYTSATDPIRSVLSRFSVSADDPNRADPDTELIILEFPRTETLHNGGQLHFGPDGYLYLALGDGFVNLPDQGPSTLLGSIIRIDVSSVELTGAYTIPADNPFVGRSPEFREEIWAYGFRHPWRFSFDRLNGDLWATDVGSGSFEEVDLVRPGLNYGWPAREGFDCHKADACESEGLEPPVAGYSHDEGCAAIGGYVYRGSRYPEIEGAYIFGDFCSGTIWALRYDGQGPATMVKLFEGEVSDGTTDFRLQITSFAEDPAGELYMTSTSFGSDQTSEERGGIYRLVLR